MFSCICRLGIGKSLKLPASHMMGPLSLGFVLSISGLIQLNVPNWLPHLAQFVIGTSLGSPVFWNIKTCSLRALLSGSALELSCCRLVLHSRLLTRFCSSRLGSAFCELCCWRISRDEFDSLSLNFNPVIVALHHLFRIVLTVSFCGIFANVY